GDDAPLSARSHPNATSIDGRRAPRRPVAAEGFPGVHFAVGHSSAQPAVGSTRPLRSGTLHIRPGAATPQLRLYPVRRRATHLPRGQPWDDGGGNDSSRHLATLPTAVGAGTADRAIRSGQLAPAQWYDDDPGAPARR